MMLTKKCESLKVLKALNTVSSWWREGGGGGTVEYNMSAGATTGHIPVLIKQHGDDGAKWTEKVGKWQND